MLVPHAVDADGGGGEVGEDGGERCVGEEGDVGIELEFMGKKAEVVDAGGVVCVSDGADKEEVRLLSIVVVFADGGRGG